MASAAPVKTASAAEAGASARRKTMFLSARTKTAEGAGANAALATRLGIAAGGPAVAAEGLWCFFGTVVNTPRASAVADGRLSLCFVMGVNTARTFASIESVAVIKRPAWRVIPPVIENRVVMMPIATPVAPTPRVAAKISDAKAISEKDDRAVVPNPRIRIPTGPRGNRASVHNPRIVRRNVDDFRADWFNLDVGAFRRCALLRRWVEMARLLRAAAHHLNGVHHVLFLVVVGVAEGRGPRKVFIHVAEDRRKRDERLDARIPRLYDPGTKQLVWTGRATKTIDPGSNHEKNMKNLDKAMAKLLKNYPPKQK